MHELVLGGEGLIGAALASALRRRGHRVTSLDLRTGTDLRRAERAPFEACDRVWFLAWDVGGSKFLEDRHGQHEQFLHNTAVSQSVFDHLYATRKPFLFTSSQLAGRDGAYGASKLLAESWTEHLGGKIARLWNVYGWEQPGHRSHAVTDFIHGGLERGEVECRTDGSERRRLLYKDDAAAALVHLMDSSSACADIAGPEWVPLREIAVTIASALGARCRFGVRAGSELLIEPVHVLAGWEPAVSLTAGLAATIADARATRQRL